MHWIWVWEHSKHFPYKFMVIASLLYSISAYERFHENALISDSGENLYFPGNDDYCWGWREYHQYQQCRGVGFQALGRDLFGFEGDDKKSLWYFFSHFFSAYVFIEICFYHVFRYLSMLIFRKICAFMACIHITVEFFSNSLFFRMLWTSFFFFLRQIYFYTYYGYLHRNIFKFILLSA